MKLKRFAALTLALVMCLTMLAGCGSTPPPASSAAPAEPTAPAAPAEPAAPAPAEKVTIKVSAWDMATTPYVQATADAFMKANPNITVEMIDIPSAEYTNKLSVMLNGGSDVDAFWIKDADTTLSLHTKGQLADLTEYINKDSYDMSAYNGLEKNFNFDGKIVGLPSRSDWYVLYYNKDLFDAAKVAYPTNDMTWTQFEETAKKVTSGDGAAKNYGALFHTWNACVQNWGVVDGKNTIMATDYSFFKPYYDMVIRMQKDKTMLDYGTAKTGNIHYSNPFLTGNVAMMPMGTWFIGTLVGKKAAGETNVNWGVATIPHAEGAPAGQTVGSATPFCVNNASKNKDAAWAFTKFAAGAEGAQVLAELGVFPAYQSADLIKTATSLPGMPTDLAEGLKVSSIVLDRPIADKVADINKMLDEEHGLIMLEQNTVEQGLAAMAKRSKEIQGK